MGFEKADTRQLYAMKAIAKKKGQAKLYAALDREIKRRERRKG